MKHTARDLLLAHHAAAEPRLDALRRTAIAESLPVPARQVVHALFFPQRRVWAGLAAAWIALLALHLTQAPSPRPNPLTAQYAVNCYAANQAQLHALLSTTSSYR